MHLRSLIRALGAALAVAVPLAAHAQPFGYAANSGSDSVSVIDTATNTVVATVPVGDTPVDIAIGFGGGRVYVANVNGASVSVIDAATNSVVTTVTVGASPNGITASPDGSRVYVASTGSGTVSVIDTATNTVIATVPRPGAHGVAPSPDGTRVYIVGNMSLSVLDAATNTLVGAVGLAAGTAFRIAVTPDGLSAYVTHFGSAVVSAVNLLDSSVFPVVLSPSLTSLFGVTISPDGARVWVADIASHTITAIDTYLKIPVAQYALPGLSPYDLEFTRDGARLYIANHGSNSVSVFNPATQSTSPPITVGLRPASIAIADGAVSTPARYVAAADVAYGLPGAVSQLTLVGVMTLATGSDGVNPLTEAVVLGAGPLSFTIPAGAFQTIAPGRAAFSGDIGGRTVQAWIYDLGAASHLVVARVTGTLAPITVPVRLLFQIGNDTAGTHLKRAGIQ